MIHAYRLLNLNHQALAWDICAEVAKRVTNMPIIYIYNMYTVYDTLLYMAYSVILCHYALNIGAYAAYAFPDQPRQLI